MYSFLITKGKHKMINILNFHQYGLDGLGVAFQVLMPENSGSNPEAGSIY